WSSDVCSSDLVGRPRHPPHSRLRLVVDHRVFGRAVTHLDHGHPGLAVLGELLADFLEDFHGKSAGAGSEVVDAHVVMVPHRPGPRYGPTLGADDRRETCR